MVLRRIFRLEIDGYVSSKQRLIRGLAVGCAMFLNDKIHILRLTGLCPIGVISVLILRGINGRKM
jgi:hypothetical protein